MEQLHAQDKAKMQKSESGSGIAGEIRAIRGERASEIRAQITEKQQQAKSLRETWTSKFEAFKARKQEHDQQLAFIERLKISGKISEQTFNDEKRSMLEKLEMTMDDAKRYRTDAEELEAEIEALSGKLEDLEN